jgi:hypothetical protein
MKIRPVGAELFHADRQTDMTKLTVVPRNFANAPKKKELRKGGRGKKGRRRNRELKKNQTKNMLLLSGVPLREPSPHKI